MTYYKDSKTYYDEMISILTDVDTSEHSLIYNALMPACYELSYQSLMLDEIVKRAFAKSALDNGYIDDLEKRCGEMGITRKKATQASGIVKFNGTKGASFPINSIVSTKSGTTYITQEKVIIDENGVGYANIIANDYGSTYNCEGGDISIMPVKYSGILSVTNEEKIDNGYDIETPEDLYDRYLLKVQTPATSGNKNEYKQWCLEVEGCGSAEVKALWNGNGTVKCIIADSNKRAASKELIDNVFNHIEDVRPIGPTITVVSVEELNLNINLNIVFDSSKYTVEELKMSIEKSISDYLKKIALKIKYISIAKIGAIILSVEGVDDYYNLTINNSSSNLIIEDNQIAILNEVVFND